MNIQNAYDDWSVTYDQMENKTRDLECIAQKEMLGEISFKNVLEIGCGTGKNTEWLKNKATSVTAVDISNEMLTKAKMKIKSANVNFVQANILEPWAFTKVKLYDLVSFSLVLEHIQNLKQVFDKANKALKNNGLIYIGELHPYKQYSGSNARFETDKGTEIVECYNHHISEFLNAAEANSFKLLSLKEYFDQKNNQNIPRILALLFQKN